MRQVPDDIINAIANDITENIGENNGLNDPSVDDHKKPYEERSDVTYEDIPTFKDLPPDIRITKPIFRPQPLPELPPQPKADKHFEKQEKSAQPSDQKEQQPAREKPAANEQNGPNPADQNHENKGKE